jgi:hypothetical protein
VGRWAAYACGRLPGDSDARVTVKEPDGIVCCSATVSFPHFRWRIKRPKNPNMYQILRIVIKRGRSWPISCISGPCFFERPGHHINCRGIANQIRDNAPRRYASDITTIFVSEIFEFIVHANFRMYLLYFICQLKPLPELPSFSRASTPTAAAA